MKRLTYLIPTSIISVSLIASIGAACSSPFGSSLSQSSGSSALFGEKFYTLEAQLDQMTEEEKADLAILRDSPAASWFGEWSGNIEESAKKLADLAPDNQYAMAVLYNIPNRDCNSYSAGGLSDESSYLSWIQSFADGIGSQKAIIVLEPDALAHMTCLDSEQQKARLALLSQAVDKLKAQKNKKVYIDAGHSSWNDAELTKERLLQAGIEKADGFALNVSNYQTTESNLEFGKKVIAALGMKEKGFIIDISRNGNGPDGDNWCNPKGRAIGGTPNWQPGKGGADGLLWIKRPGESDGECGGGPAAGVFWKEMALELVRNAK